MLKKTDLEMEQLRAAFRLVGDCRCLASDVFAWNQCLVNGLMQLTSSRFIATFTFEHKPGALELGEAKVFFENWEQPQYRQTWLNFFAAGEMERLLTVQRFFAEFNGWRVARRVDLISDEEWATCREFAVLRKACNQDDLIMTGCMVPGTNLLFCVTLNRHLGDEPYSLTDRHTLELILEELVPRIGSELRLNDVIPYRTLPPRLLQVFELLMQSETEKSIASQLGLSPHTVHDYVMELYRRFQINRRSALISTALEMGWKPVTEALPDRFNRP